MTRLALLAAVIALGLAACATGPQYNQTQALDAISAAEAKTAEAARVEMEWSETGTLINKAREALSRGDLDTAITLAREAEYQSSMALRQYDNNKGIGPSAYIR